ncbi:MAG: hypothetical protein H0W65_05885 [Sphingomonas sp.]|uniref:hypothetical protein n=1 Tax=Sphingomonas sp. TaxID=28214 RepID=UPI0017AD965F|nr:hypothetical protein [Sphingomonas sp.]MBA3667234.1 hypothetical protein [Sphingomonas sp.]
MQGKLIISLIALVGLAAPAVANEPPRRPACSKPDPRPPQVQPKPRKTEACRMPKAIPPVVDPTPMFLL